MKRIYDELGLSAYTQYKMYKADFDDFDEDFTARHPALKAVVDCALLTLGCVCLIASIVLAAYCFVGPEFQLFNGLALLGCVYASVNQIWFVLTDDRKVGYSVLKTLFRVLFRWIRKQ